MSYPSPPSPPSPAQPSQLLEIPTLPSPSSRFVLPPAPSDLLNRLQAFLPQIRDANAELEGRMREDGLGEGEEEAVVMEELSESEEDSSEGEETSSDEESEGDEDEELADAGSEGVQGGQEVEQEQEAGSLARLMDISARPKVVKKNLVVVEETAAAGGE